MWLEGMEWKHTRLPGVLRKFSKTFTGFKALFDVFFKGFLKFIFNFLRRLFSEGSRSNGAQRKKS